MRLNFSISYRRRYLDLSNLMNSVWPRSGVEALDWMRSGHVCGTHRSDQVGKKVEKEALPHPHSSAASVERDVIDNDAVEGCSTTPRERRKSKKFGQPG